MTDKTQPTAHAEITEPISADLRRIEQEAQELPEPSPTAGMNLGQRILHVGGRENAAGYIEFGSVAAVRALVGQVLRDLPSQAAAKCLHRADAAHDPALEKPEAGRYVLAWTEGVKVPIRAMWAPQFFLEMADDDAESGEYCEAKDQYFCPEGWYENNAHEETHWNVDRPVIAWMELPRLDAALQAAPPTPAAVAVPNDAVRNAIKELREKADECLSQAPSSIGVFAGLGGAAALCILADCFERATGNIPAQEHATQLAGQAQEKCVCTFAQRVVGDGCRHCNPQEYIDRLHKCLNDYREEADTPAQAQEDALDAAELREIQRAAEQFADCGETDVDSALLMRAAQAGYLECTHFQVMNESALNLDAASAAQGGAKP
ncbi:hypothetical protein [Acidovorax sp. CCYZU-2555]|uniref:hypothetical protein n=1 Tax=Acidovorax sp. CCYZU-2555 TaxID=2835042 RepID=UPI001BD07729|nr:hypothetical protein [Acidovorax sp. CCYZU-2555]MBS7777651.1 hypothetical protein [Acidovorax sp. CCYZU-2555]